MKTQAIVFLTHIESERIFRHFRRLQRETKNLLSAILCIHNPVPSLGQRMMSTIWHRGDIPSPYITVDARAGARLLPNRFAQMKLYGRWYNRGFPDLAYMPALLDQRLREYEYVWLMENDVDYAGNWGAFFGDTVENDADLLATYIYPRYQNRDWLHWSWFDAPPEVQFFHHTSSFNAIIRFSRRMLLTYTEAVRDDRWQGHTEALWPTIARHNGLTVCDLGGAGPFCPEAWRDKHYHNPLVARWNHLEPGRGDLPNLEEPPFWLSRNIDSLLKAGSGEINGADRNLVDEVTFICGPPIVQSAYFHEDPTGFLERDVLYHPVKAGWTKTSQQHRSYFPAVRRRLRPLKAAFRNWLK
jgi:hypothetical protein